MKYVTLSADARLIEAARERARRDGSTLEEQFRQWLTAYARREDRADAALRVIEDLRTYVRTGGQRFTRDDTNER